MIELKDSLREWKKTKWSRRTLGRTGISAALREYLNSPGHERGNPSGPDPNVEHLALQNLNSKIERCLNNSRIQEFPRASRCLNQIKESVDAKLRELRDVPLPRYETPTPVYIPQRTLSMQTPADSQNAPPVSAPNTNGPTFVAASGSTARHTQQETQPGRGFAPGMQLPEHVLHTAKTDLGKLAESALTQPGARETLRAHSQKQAPGELRDYASGLYACVSKAGADKNALNDFLKQHGPQPQQPHGAVYPGSTLATSGPRKPGGNDFL